MRLNEEGERDGGGRERDRRREREREREGGRRGRRFHAGGIGVGLPEVADSVIFEYYSNK